MTETMNDERITEALSRLDQHIKWREQIVSRSPSLVEMREWREIIAARLAQQPAPDSHGTPIGQAAFILQRVVDEMGDEAHERRQSDNSTGIVADPETADMLVDWSNQITIAKHRLSEQQPAAVGPDMAEFDALLTNACLTGNHRRELRALHAQALASRVQVPEVTDEDIEAACRAYCGDLNPDTITNYSGVPVWKLYETECRAVLESYRARLLAEQGAK